MSYLLITKPNLYGALNSLKNATTLYSLFRNARGRMTQKISQNKTYVAVNVPNTVNSNTSSKLFGVFRRNSSTAKADEKKQSEYARLFSLAKPEKWNILGKPKYLFVISEISLNKKSFRGSCPARDLEHGDDGHTLQFRESVRYNLH